MKELSRVRRAVALAASGLVLGVGAGCSADEGPANEPSADAPTGDASATVTDEVATTDTLTDLTTPWGLVTLDDGTYLLGSRDTGEITQVNPAESGDDQATSRLVTTLDDIRVEGEGGLLGLAVSPDQGTVFAYLTTDEGEKQSEVVAMAWDGTTLGDPEPVVTGIPGGATFHQGGGLAVGPDGLLYVSTGDNAVPENAQDKDSLSGKILRYTLDGDPAPDNPFDTAVYTYGHRNVEGLTFDDAGRLWASEFGQNRYDELNLIEAGNNYGWPKVEGTGGGSEFTDPVAVWRVEDASPVGIAFWDGSLWLGALRGQTLWEVPLDGTDVAAPIPHLRQQLGRLRTVHVAPDGDSLLVGTSNTDGSGDPQKGDDRILIVTR